MQKKTITRTRKWRLEIWRETTLRQITRDVAESCNPQTWHPLTPRRHPPSVRLLCIRHRGQVRRLQGRCYKFPLLFSPLVILRAILLSVSLTNLYQQGEETSSGLKQYCRIDRDLYYLALSIPSVKIQSFFLLNCWCICGWFWISVPGFRCRCCCQMSFIPWDSDHHLWPRLLQAYPVCNSITNEVRTMSALCNIMLFWISQSDIISFDKQTNNTSTNVQVMRETNLLEGNLFEV